VKRVIFIVLILILAVVACLAWTIRSAWHRLKVEDRIHHSYLPVVLALTDFAQSNGAPAIVLQDLIPDHIDEIPTSPYADSVSYTMLEEPNAWEFAVQSTALRKRRIYSHRSNGKYTPEEENRIVLRYHGLWCVMEE